MLKNPSARLVAETLADCGTPLSFPDPWHKLPPSRDVLQLPHDFGMLLDRLQTAHTTEELISTGIISDGTDGVQLSPALAQPDQLILVQRAADRSIVDVVTERGGLFGERLSMFSTLAPEAAASEDELPVIAAASLLDVAVLRTLGFRAALATELADIAPRDLREFSDRFGLAMYTVCDDAGESYEDAAVDELDSDSTRLILAGWNVGALDSTVPEGLRTIISHFGDLHRHLHINCFSLQVWRPQNLAIDKFRFGLRFDDFELVREALRGSLDFTCDLSIAGRATPSYNRPLDTLADAWSALIDTNRLPDDSFGREKRREIEHKLRTLHFQNVTRLMQIDAMQRPDALERELGLSAAQLGEVLFEQNLDIEAKLAKRIPGAANPCWSELPLAEVNTVLKLTNGLLRIHRELHRNNSSTPFESNS